MKAYRELIQKGTFYRMQNPWEKKYAAWICVNRERTEAIASCYRIWNEANQGFGIWRMKGLDEKKIYRLEVQNQAYENNYMEYSGSELMYAGIGLTGLFKNISGDFQAVTLIFKEVCH